MHCPDCQRDIPSDSLFCCYCGEALQRCPICELFFFSNAAFCGSCGGELRSAEQPGFNPPHGVDDGVFGYLYDPDSPDTYYPLLEGDNTVGAGGNNDIIIERPAISWNHAIVICRDERLLLQDSASTNGTFLNDTRIRVPRKLNHDDMVRFGNEEFLLWLQPSMRGTIT